VHLCGDVNGNDRHSRNYCGHTINHPELSGTIQSCLDMPSGYHQVSLGLGLVTVWITTPHSSSPSFLYSVYISFTSPSEITWRILTGSGWLQTVPDSF